MGIVPAKRSRPFAQGFRKNARLYLKSKIGVIGLAIIVFFILLAIFAPYLTKNNPVTGYNVSAPYSVPQWATVFPRYQDLAVTSNLIAADSFATQSDVSAWALSGANFTAVAEPSAAPPGNITGYAGALLVDASIVAQQQTQVNPYLPGGQQIFSMSKDFQFTTKPPTDFTISAFIKPIVMTNVSTAYLNFIITSPTKAYALSTVQSYTLRQEVVLSPQQLNEWDNVTIPSGLLTLSGLPAFANSLNPAATIFAQPGKYQFTMQVQVVPSGNRSTMSFYTTGIVVHILGKSYGLLGTDNYGRDLWSQFVYGSRVSLEIGILSGVGAVALGTLAGLVAGYLGGMADEIISRITDFFLVLPFLPLAIIAVLLIGQNPVLYSSIYVWIITLFVVLSWPTITRIIRSQVLSVKERQYVEASRALGGGSGHIIRKHILPNVMGLVYSQTALNVAGFILLEAALDFLAVAIHPITTITWGITLTNALPDALSNSTVDYAWWWFLPPGIAIAALSLAFVLVGFALDSIFNPRLRAR